MPISTAATQSILHRCGTHQRVVLSGIEVVREGRVEPFVYACPTRTSATVCWSGVALENYSNAPVIVPRHEHLEHFVHLVVRGSVKYEVLTGGKTLRYQSGPGTTFIVPRGTIDELRWGGPTDRIAVAIHPSLLSSALDETIGRTDIEMIERWNLTDQHIMAVLLAMTTDLDEGSPAGRLYGDSLANALAVYLLTRYSTRHYAPERHRGALPRYLLKRVLDHIDEHLAADISLTQLATVAGMSSNLNDIDPSGNPARVRSRGQAIDPIFIQSSTTDMWQRFKVDVRRVLAGSCLPPLPADHIVTGCCSAHTCRSPRQGPETS